MDTALYTMRSKDSTTNVDAAQIAPGLFVYRLPDNHQPASPHRWRIGHHSGLSVADAMRREAAIAGAELLSTLADWKQDADALREQVNPSDLFVKLSYVDCIEPATEPYDDGADVSNNGRYTEADIREAVAESEGMDALQILCAMSHTAPWMGLDTEDFVEAHNRIVELANAA